MIFWTGQGRWGGWTESTEDDVAGAAEVEERSRRSTPHRSNRVKSLGPERQAVRPCFSLPKGLKLLKESLFGAKGNKRKTVEVWLGGCSVFVEVLSVLSQIFQNFKRDSRLSRSISKRH